MTLKDATQSLMLIDGAERPALDGRTIPIDNPARIGETIAHVPRATGPDVDVAVQSAARAFSSWRSVNPRERGRSMLRIADLLEASSEDIASTIALETGNAIRTQSRPEARGAAEIFRYFGGLAGELKGEVTPMGDDLLVYTRREPLGVVGGIVPWNSPVLLSALKIAMSITAGNSLVLKAAEDAPLAVLKMGAICNQVLPAGVLNVLTGYGEEAGQALIHHPLISKLSFTGSTEVGKLVMHAAAERILPISLELGGKSPAIVFPDSNDEATVNGVIAGMRFTRQGQSCTAGSRLFVHESIHEEFLDQIVQKLSQLKLGDPLSEETDMGAIINQKQFDRVCQYIDEGINQPGSQVSLGGLPDRSGPLSQGFFVQPTVIDSVNNSWRIAREEIFGPVLVVIPWSDEEDVIRMANDSHYGLAAYVWCKDITKALRTAHAIESGWVQINRGLGQLPGHSYGGFKMSGLGREFSLEGMLDSFTQRKSVTVGL